MNENSVVNKNIGPTIKATIAKIRDNPIKYF